MRVQMLNNNANQVWISLFLVGGTLCTAVATKLYIERQTKLKQQGDAVEGFPSPPNPHWLLGHLVALQGKGNRPDGTPKTFVDGYQTVFVNHADPNTGRGSFWFFNRPTVYLTRGNDVKTVLNSSSYRKPTPIIDMHLTRFLGQKTLVTLTGKEWRLYRSALHKSFTPRAVEQSQHIIDQVGAMLTETLLKKATAAKPALTIPILQLMKMATIDVFGLAALNVDFQCSTTLEMSPVASAFDFLGQEYTRRLKSILNPTSWLYDIPTPTNRRHRQQSSILRTFVTSQIQKARSKNSTGINNQEKKITPTLTSDLLSNLVKATDAEAYSKDGSTKSNDEALGDVLLTLLFGGYDTTSITITYALYLLAKHPEYEQKCLEEIETVFGTANGSSNDCIGPDQLPYTKAVVMETLRLYPPAPLTNRCLERTVQLPSNGQEKQSLNEGQMVLVPIWCIQRDPHNFPRPDEMLPDRWAQHRKGSPTNGESSWEERLPSSIGNDDESPTIPVGNRDAFCVFSAGARSCVGRVLAMQEAVTLLACLIRKLKFELVDPEYIVQATSTAVVQQPSDGLPMVVKRRPT